MKSETRKLPKGHSYPLRPSILEAALVEAGIGIDAHLIRSPGSYFAAYFWPPNPNVPYERLYVHFGSVPRERGAEARHRVETVMLPDLIKWLADILALDSNYSPIRREQQRFDLGQP